MIDLKLLQYGEPSGQESSERQVISRMLITFETLNRLATKERVSVWNLPLSALQRKMYVMCVVYASLLKLIVVKMDAFVWRQTALS